MKKHLLTISLIASLIAVSANAALCPVSGTLSSNADAFVQGGQDSFDSDSINISLTTGGYVNSFATSQGSSTQDPYSGDPFMDPGFMDPGMPPAMSDAMADSMADMGLILREDGFAISGNGHAGVNGGPGRASFSNQFNFSFELSEESSCDIIMNTGYYTNGGSSSSSIYLKNLSQNNLLSLTSADGNIETTITLAAGIYYVTAYAGGSVDTSSYIPGMVWGADANFGMDFTASAVPEPATLMILGLGSLGLLRKKR